MKDILARISREPNLILGVVTAGLSLAVLFGADLTSEQMAGIGLFIGAVFALVRFLTTPANEVLVQIKKPSGEVVAGGAAPPAIRGEQVEVGMSTTAEVLAQQEQNGQHP